MPIITFPFLDSVNTGVQLAYNTQFSTAPSIWQSFCADMTSAGSAEIYPRLNMLKGMREWIGDRQVQSLSTATFEIQNRTFEETIGVNRENLEDDKYGFLSGIAGQLGLNAKRLPDLLVAKLIKAGHTTLCYDGQNFFDTAHPGFDANGNASTFVNYDTDGSGALWYLISTSEITRGVIVQRRRPFQVIPKFSMTDPQVFWNKEFEWGVDGRMNVGFGLPHFVYMSTSAMTLANIQAARTAMASLRRADGAPMGIIPNMLMTGTALYPTARAFAENEFVPGVTQTPNTLRGLFAAQENPWLN